MDARSRDSVRVKDEAFAKVGARVEVGEIIAYRTCVARSLGAELGGWNKEDCRFVRRGGGPGRTSVQGRVGMTKGLGLSPFCLNSRKFLIAFVGFALCLGTIGASLAFVNVGTAWAAAGTPTIVALQPDLGPAGGWDQGDHHRLGFLRHGGQRHRRLRRRKSRDDLPTATAGKIVIGSAPPGSGTVSVTVTVSGVLSSNAVNFTYASGADGERPLQRQWPHDGWYHHLHHGEQLHRDRRGDCGRLPQCHCRNELHRQFQYEHFGRRAGHAQTTLLCGQDLLRHRDNRERRLWRKGLGARELVRLWELHHVGTRGAKQRRTPWNERLHLERYRSGGWIDGDDRRQQHDLD